MFKLNLIWQNFNTNFKDGVKEHYEMKVPCNSSYSVLNDGFEIYAIQNGVYKTHLGTFNSIDEAKKFCEEHYTNEILKIIKDL